ncbi:hypothetical protein [Haliangium ochraceum]|uniref:Uncharacterized protein n=1 Tax=Haliangium ochraceum (strain DSM 14365 / JCM 11303 / SMP-2) TaxID=502025 RepID=D0LMG3_HALO1|nr:hypothetical protein [Haliangium ochraceum]ACY16869.1 hypothetical protein Hoch_4375 [Haliangium ochraceum DSM 14365]
MLELLQFIPFQKSRTLSVYLNVTIQLHNDKAAAWPELGEELKSILEGDFEWTLVAALSTMFGRLNRIIHIWEVPAPGDVFATLEALGGKHPELVARVDACIAEETFELMAAYPYHPVSEARSAS